jgi:hypothetical protein
MLFILPQPDGIKMHIPAELQQVRIPIHHDRLESPLKQMPDPAVSAVEITGVRDIQMSHELGKIATRCFEHQMKMIHHQHISVKTDTVCFQGALKMTEEGLIIGPIPIDRSLLIATAGHMIESAGIIDP